MWKYTVRRLLVAIPILVIISALDFFVINLAPGDPLQSLLPPETGINAGELHDLYARSGLADSIPVRYVRWLGQLARGNLGTSFQTSQPVTRMLRETLPPTLLLTATAQALALLLGIPLGVVGALRERSLLDHALTLLSFVLTALPSFF